MDNKRAIIIGGGTVSWVRSHLALAAPAYGQTALRLAQICRDELSKLDTIMYLTIMAGGDSKPKLETNEDVSNLVEELINDTRTKVIFFPVAMVDWELRVSDGSMESMKYTPKLNRKYTPRLKSEPGEYDAKLVLTEKVIQKIRKTRKDIFLVGFKHSQGLDEYEQYRRGLNLCKEASCNLVLANDTGTGLNMVITPEEAKYHVTTDRDEALRGLVDMTKLRSHLSFTRSTVVAGEPVAWKSPLVPSSLRAVVDYCIQQNAYKPFRGSTVGHFAVKIDDTTFLTSQRKTNFNDLAKIGLVKVTTDSPDTVLAYGAKPSVGGQSQRIVFNDHPGNDCIVHFHCPIKPGSEVSIRSQYEFECGSHECGKNTSDGLKQFGNLKAVYLDEHGPNIVFPRNIDPKEVISFIDDNFDLSKKTGGYVSS